MISWLVTGYHVVGRELRIYEGLLWRRTRAIPLERLQSVEVVRPLLARVFGLAELRLEVVGAGKTEAPLAFLPVREAGWLRERLLTIARGAAVVRPSARYGRRRCAARLLAGRAAVERGSPGAVADPAGAVRRYGTRRDAGATRPRHGQPRPGDLAAAAATVVGPAAGDRGADLLLRLRHDLDVHRRRQHADRHHRRDPGPGPGAARRLAVHHRDDGRRAAIPPRPARDPHQTVPPARIQAVAVEWPLLWRGMRWVRAQMHVAGVATERNDQRTGSLLPVGDVATAERVVAEALPGFVLTQVAVLPVPRRARWLVPLRRRVLGYQLTDTAFVTRDGLLTRRLVVVPYARIQSVRIRQGPLQRALRLASVWVDTAGGGVEAVALHRDVAEARWLAAELAERSRAARRPPALTDVVRTC